MLRRGGTDTETPSVSSTDEDWPRLTLSEWDGTRQALQLWTQIVGKVRLAVTPMVNHWWQVPLYVSARGLTTSLMHTGGRGLEIEFDFIEHRLDMRTTDGSASSVALEPCSVADFYRATMMALDELGVSVSILPRPVETVEAVRFPDDTAPRPYDADAAHRFWLALVQSSRVMGMFRGHFIGKASPVHFFWGAADLAVTRFSGRPAPKHPGGVPNCADWVQELAYSHEVSSCGFWPGGSDEGSFYSYAYPVPEGFPEAAVEPAGEFLLPYSVVRSSTEPDAALLSFFDSTYAAAADLAGWDRKALEVSEP
jgi:hypothetical protein